MTTTTQAQPLSVRYFWNAPEPRPEHVARLDDGRIIARWAGSEDLTYYPNQGAFTKAYPNTAFLDWPNGEEEVPYQVEVSDLISSINTEIYWTEVHHLMAEIDRARRGSDIGRLRENGTKGATDAFGGAYRAGPNSPPQLIKLIHSVNLCARDAWNIVHDAGYNMNSQADARIACKVAIACSRAYAMFYRAGLIEDPSQRCCGTGEGYGLTGLAWLAGLKRDLGVTSAAVEAFAAGRDLERIAL